MKGRTAEDAARETAATLAAGPRRDDQAGQSPAIAQVSPSALTEARIAAVTISDQIQKMWSDFLAWLSTVVIPDWGALIGLMPC